MVDKYISAGVWRDDYKLLKISAMERHLKDTLHASIPELTPHKEWIGNIYRHEKTCYQWERHCVSERENRSLQNARIMIERRSTNLWLYRIQLCPAVTKQLYDGENEQIIVTSTRLIPLTPPSYRPLNMIKSFVCFVASYLQQAFAD